MSFVKNLAVNGQNFASDSFYSFPEIWQNVSYLAGYLNYLLGILSILLITNEFSFKTSRQNVVDGLSRREVILSKTLVICFIAIFCGIVVLGYTLLSGISIGNYEYLSEIWGGMHYPFLFIIQAIGYMSLAALIAFVVKKAAASIVLFLAYVVLIERIVRFRIPDEIDRYFPMKAIGSMIVMPGEETVEAFTGFSVDVLAPEMAALISCGYIVLFLSLSYLILKKRDL